MSADFVFSVAVRKLDIELTNGLIVCWLVLNGCSGIVLGSKCLFIASLDIDILLYNCVPEDSELLDQEPAWIPLVHRDPHILRAAQGSQQRRP